VQIIIDTVHENELPPLTDVKKCDSTGNVGIGEGRNSRKIERIGREPYLAIS